MKKLKGLLILPVLFASVAFCVAASPFYDSLKSTKNEAERYECKRCGGSGKDPYVVKTCTKCTGGTVEQWVDCSTCNGMGYTVDRYGDRTKCHACDGAKKVRATVTCPSCGGNYQEPISCMQCNGKGYVIK